MVRGPGHLRHDAGAAREFGGDAGRSGVPSIPPRVVRAPGNPRYGQPFPVVGSPSSRTRFRRSPFWRHRCATWAAPGASSTWPKEKAARDSPPATLSVGRGVIALRKQCSCLGRQWLADRVRSVPRTTSGSQKTGCASRNGGAWRRPSWTATGAFLQQDGKAHPP